MLKNILALARLALLATLTGCTSISSTMLNRTDADFYVGNSNGRTKCDGQSRPFKGVPITVRVPTHLDVAIKESIMLAKDTETNELYQLASTRRHVFVEASLVESDKVFTVDPKRPAAGTMGYTFLFGDKAKAGDPDNSQYFKSISYQIKDRTVNEVNASLNTLLPLLARQSMTGRQAAAGEKISIIQEEIVGVVAWKRFDIDAPDFEAQVECFVEQHLNCCGSCQPGLAQ